MNDRIAFDKTPRTSSLEPTADFVFGPYARLTDYQIDRILEGTTTAPKLKIRVNSLRHKGQVTKCSMCGRAGHNRNTCSG